MQTFLWKLRNLRHLLRGVPDMILGMVRPVGRLHATVFRADGTEERLGLISTRVVTTAGVNAIVDAFQGTFVLSDFKWHAMGTGSVAENVTDTALGTQVESRVSGTQVEGASANIYRTVATITATAARAVSEHAVFSASTGAVMLDRSVFTVINLANGDSVQFTFELSLPAGS